MAKTKDFQFRIELGGDIEVSEATVTILRITRSEPILIETRNLRGPSFTASLPLEGTQSFYAVARIRKILHGGEGIELKERSVQLVSVFTHAATTVALSERVTVATAYSFARFLRIDSQGSVILCDPNQAAGIAYGMKNNFISTDGDLSRVIRSTPNGMETNSLAMFNFLSNLVYYCLIDPKVYSDFTRLTRSGSALGALLELTRDPFIDPEAIYGTICGMPQIFEPSLTSLEAPASPIPNQWTLTLKVNDSGAENFMIAGVGYLDFDKNDRLWLTNNVRQGTPNSSTFCVVLEPDGSPAPFSPLFGGGLLGAGFGIAADPEGEKIYVGNFGWGPTEWNPQQGSISAFSHDGSVLSPSKGYTEGLSRVQGMEFDAEGNLWMASWGSQDPMPYTASKYDFKSERSAVVVYLEGDPERALVHSFDSPYDLTFDVTVDPQGHAYVSNSGYGGDESRGLPAVASSVYKLRIDNGKLCVLAKWVSPKGYEAFRQVAVGADGYVYVGGVASSRVIRLDRDLRHPHEIKKNIYGPWGLTFGGDGTLFVANFLGDLETDSETVGETETGTLPEDEGMSRHLGPHSVTVLREADEKTARLMTVPTGGHEVTLANGLPLYGNPKTPSGDDIPLHSYDPLMRLTATRIDRAGNLWACNNWKPSAAIDVVRGNPGGDGLVAFVGIAEPTPRD